MRLNRSALAVAAVVTMLVATVGIAAAVTPSGQTDLPSKQIEVANDATVSADPDQAIIHVGVVAAAEDAQTVRDRVAANASELRSTLESLGIPSDQIETRDYDIDEERERPEPDAEERPAAVRYRGVHAFEITLNDTERVGDVIDAVVDSGANRVQGVTFTLSEERRQQLRQNALEKAMDRARQDADTLASSAGLTADTAASISATDVQFHPYSLEAEMTSADSGGSTTIDSGPVDVSASVQVVYNATSA